MKNLKSKILLISFIFGIITIVYNFNFEYWGQMLPIYVRGFTEQLPLESDNIKLPRLPNPFITNREFMGVDEDKNGIRDDLDLWVAVKGHDYNERMALRSALKFLQLLLFHAGGDDFAKSQEAYEEYYVATQCLSYISNSLKDWEKFDDRLENKIFSLTFNTKERDFAINYVARGVLVYGPPARFSKGIPLGEGYKVCDFKIKNLPELFLLKEINKRKSIEASSAAR